MNGDEKRNQEKEDEREDLELEDEDAEKVAGGGDATITVRKAGKTQEEFTPVAG